MTFNTLTPEEQRVIQDKGTERPFTGKFNEHFENGLYLCKQCDAPLYRSEHKFPSHCGWPSFDDEIEGAVARHVDADGRRTEIVCAHCGGHLGHVFEGEMQTAKNIRHCVNSISMNFVSAEELAHESGSELNKAYFAGGCFWGVEHLLQQVPGVESVVSGYMGGASENPTYTQVCSKTTGHLEVVEVSYDAGKVSYETLAKLFFEIHDPTQLDGQGPDLGSQYASAVFVADDQERETIEGLIDILKDKGHEVVTRVLPMAPFWRAEEYHQDYYAKTGKAPYCHRYEKKF
ncbi:bifunctional methionine sulfoxide reductase B/A protein [Marinobacterium sedimentorum]|uniref:bifunctional methionine sulfoxide reductase B/A protein n=1 Tax=Marinobacterium sedimentorum TaxID=2927804 RepID=UPI0020C64CC8|nr:bifunctional methionine sulfoxide reductase B/A protein [Marinobacterium sedimentorum]MCP8688028.1 bifunctional methionine sulfoxide reductase B/A protein [Marinobacterium sedimentorum]